MDIWRGEKIKAWRKLVKNKDNTCTCACGIAEVNAVLTPKLENKIFRPFSVDSRTEESEALVK